MSRIEIYHQVAYPVLNRVDSERAQNKVKDLFFLAESNEMARREVQLAVWATGGNRLTESELMKLRINFGGVEMKNGPVILAEGWLKRFRGVQTISRECGYSLAMTGSVSEYPQPGNIDISPRMTGKGGMGWNYMGLNNDGMEVSYNDALQYTDREYPLGISLVKNNDMPIEQTPETIYRLATKFAGIVDVMGVNVSCPNGGTNTYISVLGDTLKAVTQAVKEAGRPIANIFNPEDKKQRPIVLLLKESPDRSNYEHEILARAVIDNRFTGITLFNTTVNSGIKREAGFPENHGGGSGKIPGYISLCEQGTLFFYDEFGDQLAIVGSGGIDSETAVERIKRGTLLVSENTSMRGEGPGTARLTNHAILEEINRLGLNHVTEMVGMHTKRGPLVNYLPDPLILRA